MESITFLRGPEGTAEEGEFLHFCSRLARIVNISFEEEREVPGREGLPGIVACFAVSCKPPIRVPVHVAPPLSLRQD